MDTQPAADDPLSDSRLRRAGRGPHLPWQGAATSAGCGHRDALPAALARSGVKAVVHTVARSMQGGSGSVRLLIQEAPPAEQAAGFTGEAAVATAHGLHAHHTYDAPADPYSCDFAAVPGAWTAALPAGSTADQPAEGAALFGTAIAQATIWRHQHPADCGRARFLLHRPQARTLNPKAQFPHRETLGRAQKKRRGLGRKQLSRTICAEGAWLWWWRLDAKALPVRLVRKKD